MDLTKQFPRSPRERLRGIAMFPRTIDKARAKLADKLGEYIYDCPMDKQLYATLGCTADEFLQAVRVSSTDAEVADLLMEGRKPIAEDELKKHNALIDDWRPSTPESWEHFKADILKIAPGNRKITSRTDLIDFEEGRFPAAK